MFVTHSVKEEKLQRWHVRLTRSPPWWKDQPAPWRGQHQSFHESERSRSSPRDIINCHNSSLINKVLKRRCGWRPGYISAWFVRRDTIRSRTRVKGQTVAVGFRAAASQAGLFQRCSCSLPASRRDDSRNFSRLQQSYLSQNKLLQICETNIE